MPTPDFEALVDLSPLNAVPEAMAAAPEQYERAQLAWRLKFREPRPDAAERAEIEQRMYDLALAEEARSAEAREARAAEARAEIENPPPGRLLLRQVLRAAQDRAEHGIGIPPALDTGYRLPTEAELRESLAWTEREAAK